MGSSVFILNPLMVSSVLVSYDISLTVHLYNPCCVQYDVWGAYLKVQQLKFSHLSVDATLLSWPPCCFLKWKSIYRQRCNHISTKIFTRLYFSSYAIIIHRLLWRQCILSHVLVFEWTSQGQTCWANFHYCTLGLMPLHLEFHVII